MAAYPGFYPDLIELRTPLKVTGCKTSHKFRIHILSAVSNNLMLQFSVNEQKKVGNHIEIEKEIRQMDVYHLPDQGTAIYSELRN